MLPLFKVHVRLGLGVTGNRHQRHQFACHGFCWTCLTLSSGEAPLSIGGKQPNMPPKKAKNRNRALHPSNDANVGRKRPYSVKADSMETAISAETPKPSKKVSKSRKESVTSEEEDQCGSPQSMSTNVAIPEPSGITAPVCDDSNFNGGSAIAQTENKVSMTAGQEKFLQELEKLVKMGETTAASSHESNTGIDGLDPNNVEGNEAAYWKARFEEMSNLRLTEPEKELETYRKHTLEKIQAQDELIRELRGYNAELSGDKLKLVASLADASIPTIQEVPSSPNENESVPQLSIDKLEEKLARKRTLLALYEQLSGICIKFKEEGWIQCTALNHLHKRTVQFYLSVPDDDCGKKEVNFRPGANSNILPSYMQHALVFERNQSPLFLVKVLTNLFHEE